MSQSVAVGIENKVGIGVLVLGWAIVTQQILASIFYASLNAFTNAGQPRYFAGYIQEYLLWRVRLPTHAFSWGELTANIAAAVVVLVAVGATWWWLV